jgi:hypothetical protein
MIFLNTPKNVTCILIKEVFPLININAYDVTVTDYLNLVPANRPALAEATAH